MTLRISVISLVLLTIASGVEEANGGQYFLCEDGRTLEVELKDLPRMKREDACIARHFGLNVEDNATKMTTKITQSRSNADASTSTRVKHNNRMAKKVVKQRASIKSAETKMSKPVAVKAPIRWVASTQMAGKASRVVVPLPIKRPVRRSLVQEVRVPYRAGAVSHEMPDVFEPETAQTAKELAVKTGGRSSNYRYVRIINATAKGQQWYEHRH